MKIPLNADIGDEETFLKDALKNLDNAVPVKQKQASMKGKESTNITSKISQNTINSKDINQFLRQSQLNKNMKVIQINTGETNDKDQFIQDKNVELIKKQNVQNKVVKQQQSVELVQRNNRKKFLKHEDPLELNQVKVLEYF